MVSILSNSKPLSSGPGYRSHNPAPPHAGLSGDLDSGCQSQNIVVGSLVVLLRYHTPWCRSLPASRYARSVPPGYRPSLALCYPCQCGTDGFVAPLHRHHVASAVYHCSGIGRSSPK